MSEQDTAIISAVAQEKLGEIEKLVAVLAGAEGQLEAGYAKLAFLLKETSENRYWEGVYESFGDFLNYITAHYRIGKAQLYNFASTARELGDSLTQAQLNDMGISKAMVLRDAKKGTGNVSETAMKAALDPKVTVKELRKILFESANAVPENSDWLDLQFEFYVTDDERKLINDACNAARHTDPPISEDQKDFVQRKEIVLRWCREFLAAYSGDVIEGGKGL